MAAGMSNEREELEACCVCLDSLCSAPVTTFLAPSECGRLPEPECARRCCTHYLHADCAKKLRPPQCPLCRSRCAALSSPVDRASFSAIGAAGIIASLAQLEDSHSRSEVGVRSVLELLSATLEAPENMLQVVLHQEARGAGIGDGLVIDAQGLTRALTSLGVLSSATQGPLPLPGGDVELLKVSGEQDVAVPHGICSSTTALLTRVRRRLRWLALKASLATGASFLFGGCGTCVGIFVGGLGAVPREQLPEIRHTDDRVFLFLKCVQTAVLVAYYGSQKAHLLLRGLRYGAGIGALAGWVWALRAPVQPDALGFTAAFVAGITGRCFHLDIAGAEQGVPFLPVFRLSTSPPVLS